MANGVSKGKHKRADSHTYMEGAKLVEVDYSRQIGRIPKQSDRPSRHTENEKEQRRIECTCTALCESDAPAQSIMGPGILTVSVALPATE